MSVRRALPAHIEVMDEAVAAVLRNMTVAQRIQIASDANRTARLIVRARIESAHPDWSEQEVLREVARRMLSGAG